MYTMCMQCLQIPEEGTGSSGTIDTDSYELPCECWKLNLNPLKEQPVLLLMEPPPQPLCMWLTKGNIEKGSKCLHFFLEKKDFFNPLLVLCLGIQ